MFFGFWYSKPYVLVYFVIIKERSRNNIQSLESPDVKAKDFPLNNYKPYGFDGENILQYSFMSDYKITENSWILWWNNTIKMCYSENYKFVIKSKKQRLVISKYQTPKRKFKILWNNLLLKVCCSENHKSFLQKQKTQNNSLLRHFQSLMKYFTKFSVDFPSHERDIITGHFKVI